MSANILQLYFLGPPQFSRNGQPVELTSAKAVALLAYLAATPLPQSRERLLDLLWPDSLPDAARKNLRNTLWVIRKTFGDDLLQSADDRLNLAPSAWVDLVVFAENTASAQSPVSYLPSLISLYRGPFLDGLNLADAPDFEIWLTSERERLGQLYLRHLATLIDLYRAEQNWPEIILAARRALAYDNLHEPMYRTLMEAYARLGERSESLRQYEALRAILTAELGVEPLPETEALRAAILKGELQPASPPIPKQRPLPDRRSDRVTAAKTPSSPFVGRQAELAVLAEELQRAATGQARLVIMSGEMGIGKSRLWQEWSANLSHSEALPFQSVSRLVTLETRCLDATRTLPFAPLLELFRQPPSLQPLLSPTSALPPLWLAEIARLLPEIRLAWPDLPTPASLPRDEEQRHVFEALVQGLLALRADPLILFFDDLHWADQTTLTWLGYLTHRLRQQPLLLVATYRPEDAPPPLVHLLASWTRAGSVRKLALARLTPEESTVLVAELGGDPALAGRLQAQSGGNPYFLLELYQAAPGDIPPALAELLRARLDRLPDCAQQVLQTAAILEPGFDLPTLRRVSGRSEEEILDALDQILQTGLLGERDNRYFFAHPLVAVVVRDSLSGARRAFLHRRAAEALEVIYAGHLSPLAGRLADHFTQAGDASRAATYAEMAAQHALALAAPAEAVDFYRQAIALDPRPPRQIGLGQALQWQGDLAGARTAFEEALAEFERQGDRLGAARASLELAGTYLPAGRADETVRWAEQGLRHLGHPTGPAAVHTPAESLSPQPVEEARLDPSAHASAHLLLGSGLLGSGHRPAELAEHLTAAARLAAEYHLPQVAANSRFLLGNFLAERGDLAGAIEAFRDSIRLAQTANDQYLEVLAHNNTAYHALLAGDLAAARTHIETALALAEARALIVPLQYLYGTRGELALAEGKWAEAESWFQRGLAEAEKHHNFEHIANYQAKLSRAARSRGDLDNALILLEQARETTRPLAAPHLQIQLELWLAELYLERGERAAAAAALARAETRLAGGERRRLQAWADRLGQKLGHF